MRAITYSANDDFLYFISQDFWWGKVTLKSHFVPIRSLKMLSSCFPWFYTRLFYTRFGESFVPDAALVVPARSLDEVHQWCSRAPASACASGTRHVLCSCNLGHIVSNFAPPEGKGSLMRGESKRTKCTCVSSRGLVRNNIICGGCAWAAQLVAGAEGWSPTHGPTVLWVFSSKRKFPDCEWTWLPFFFFF